jgi:maltose-binding protein MalE
MKRLLSLAFIGLLFILAGCARPKPANELIIWSGMDPIEGNALRGIATNFVNKFNYPVKVLDIPFDDLRIKYQTAAPSGMGPDLIIGPQDWIGIFAIADLISPLSNAEFTPGERKDFMPLSLQNLTFSQKLYGIPLYLETTALIYNTELVPQPPQTMSELLQISLKLKEQGIYGLIYEIENVYFSWAFFSGYGAYFFGDKGGQPDLDDIGLANAGALKAAQWLADYRNKYKLIPLGLNSDMANMLFLSRKSAMIINGPWILQKLRDAKIPHLVTSLPKLDNGSHPHPMVGVGGIMLNGVCRQRDKALALMKYLSSPENQVKICQASGRIPARLDSLKLVQNDKDVQAFALVAQSGSPMPNHPAMMAVWSPINEALKLILAGKYQPALILQETVKRIKNNIKIMME